MKLELIPSICKVCGKHKRQADHTGCSKQLQKMSHKQIAGLSKDKSPEYKVRF